MLDSSDYHERNFLHLDFFSAEQLPDIAIYDAHVHLGFAQDARGLAERALERKIGAFCCTVTPQEFLTLEGQLDDQPHIQLGLGLHPWWIGEQHHQLDDFMALLPQKQVVGEVGLDFSDRFQTSEEAQLLALGEILRACSEQGSKVISLHCVDAYDEMLGLLFSTDVAETCHCIFHWFSGSSDQLQSAIKLGCFFSVSERMLDTKRGRSYVAQIPRERLLIETDAPRVDALADDFEPVAFSADEWSAQLVRTIEKLNELTSAV